MNTTITVLLSLLLVGRLCSQIIPVGGPRVYIDGPFTTVIGTNSGEVHWFLVAAEQLASHDAHVQYADNPQFDNFAVAAIYACTPEDQFVAAFLNADVLPQTAYIRSLNVPCAAPGGFVPAGARTTPQLSADLKKYRVNHKGKVWKIGSEILPSRPGVRLFRMVQIVRFVPPPPPPIPGMSNTNSVSGASIMTVAQFLSSPELLERWNNSPEDRSNIVQIAESYQKTLASLPARFTTGAATNRKRPATPSPPPIPGVIYDIAGAIEKATCPRCYAAGPRCDSVEFVFGVKDTLRIVTVQKFSFKCGKCAHKWRKNEVVK